MIRVRNRHRRFSLRREAVALATLLSFAAASAGCGNRLSAGGSGRTTSVVVPPLPLASEHPVAGLVAAAGADGRLRVDWRAETTAFDGVEFALFVADAPSDVFAAAPVPITIAAGHAILEGLPTTGERFVGLGVRAVGAGAYVASGPVLSAWTSSPRYVDPTVPAGSGDGATPATPTSDLILAVLDAFVSGGASVFVRGGDAGATAIPLFTGVKLCGGFAPGFALEERDPIAAATRLAAFDGQAIVRVEPGATGRAVVDGFDLEATFAVPQAIDLPGLGAEVRACRVTGASRGVKVRGLATGPRVDVVVTGCEVRGCELEGLSIDALADVVIESSTFDSNGNEGVDLNHLWSPSGVPARLVARGSRFLRNGTEGLDAHLGAPVGSAGAPGSFVVEITDCDFESNTLAGLRVDVDYEAFPTWSADVVVRGSRARANGGAGIHFDLDSNCQATAHRVACSANGGDGFLLTSETYAGIATLSCSSLVGNLGFGARLQQGNFALLASGLVVSGNQLGGIDSPVVPSSVHSSIAWLQDAPWTGVLALDDVVATSTFPPIFQSAPSEYATIVSLVADVLTLAAAPSSIGPGAAFESADDGTPRAVTSVIGTTLSVAPAIEGLRTPARGAFFTARGASLAGDAQLEDWRLAPVSAALGAGLSPPGAPTADAGPFARFVGGVPGREDALVRPLFRVAATSPAVATPIGAHVPLEIAFAGGVPDPSTAPGAVLAYSSANRLLGTISFVDADRLVVAPPPSGWSDGDRVEVHTSLRTTGGTHLGQAAVLRVRTQ